VGERVKRVPAWVAVLCLVALAACGSPPAGLNRGSWPGSVPRTVKIGIAAPFEGLYRSVGYEALYGVRLAVKERNAAGGLGGYRVELVALNDFNQAAEARVQARKMVADPLVFGVIGGLRPEAALAALPEYRTASLAYLSPTPSDLLVARGLTETLAAAVSTQAIAHVAANLAADEFQVAHAALLCGPGTADGALAEALHNALGVRGVETLPASAWTPSLLDAEALFVAAGVRDGAAWIADARAAGYAGLIVGGPELHSPLLPMLAEGSAHGVIVVSGLAPPPDSRRWQDAFREVSGGSEPGPLGWWAYSVAFRLLDALEWDIRQAGGPSRPGVWAQVAATPCSHDIVYQYVLNEQGQFVQR
jgi:ABC-type branched-subunit amino acid transport system substrate-binding protein